MRSNQIFHKFSDAIPHISLGNQRKENKERQYGLAIDPGSISQSAQVTNPLLHWDQELLFDSIFFDP